MENKDNEKEIEIESLPVAGDGAQSVEVGALLGDIAEAFPAPNESLNLEAIRAEVEAEKATESAEPKKAEPKKVTEKIKGETDEKGNRFDPEIHECDDALNPKMNRRGFICRKRGRKKGGTNTEKTDAPKQASADTPELKGINFGAENSAPSGATNADKKVALKPAANIIVCTIDSVTSSLMAMAASDSEKAVLCDAWIEYLMTKDIDDLPAGALLALGYLTIYGSKFALPEPRSRLTRLWLWSKEKLSRKRKPTQRQPDSATATEEPNIL